MAKREAFTFESNLEKITAKIEEKPYRVMNVIGQNLTKEIKATTLKSMYRTREGILKKTLGYWARRNEKDLQIGFKMSITKNQYGASPGIVGDMVAGHKDPIKPVVAKNLTNIADMIAIALQEIEKE